MSRAVIFKGNEVQVLSFQACLSILLFTTAIVDSVCREQELLGPCPVTEKYLGLCKECGLRVRKLKANLKRLSVSFILSIGQQEATHLLPNEVRFYKREPVYSSFDYLCKPFSGVFIVSITSFRQ